MFNALLNTLFGCSHRRISFPLTPRRGLDNKAGRAAETYVVCLDCGKEFGYDWQKMQIRKPVSVLIPTEAVQEKSVPVWPTHLT
jgi:hypothetical protein